MLSTGYHANSNLNFNDVASSMLKISMMIFESYDLFLDDVILLGYKIR